MASEAQILAKSAIRYTQYEIRNYSAALCLSAFVAMTKLCKTKPIFEKVKWM